MLDAEAQRSVVQSVQAAMRTLREEAARMVDGLTVACAGIARTTVAERVGMALAHVEREVTATRAAYTAPHVVIRCYVIDDAAFEPPERRYCCTTAPPDTQRVLRRMEVGGYGPTPAEACAAFDRAWRGEAQR